MEKNEEKVVRQAKESVDAAVNYLMEVRDSDCNNLYVHQMLTTATVLLGTIVSAKPGRKKRSNKLAPEANVELPKEFGEVI